MASWTDERQPWYTSRRFQVIAIIVLAAFAVGEGVVGIFLRDNDLLWHRNAGRAFLDGEPYGNQGEHYLPARMMINALTAWLPYRVNRAVVYLAAVAALAWTLATWRRLADGRRFMHGKVAFAAIVLTLAITGAYLQRDLDDCGLQILLLFFLTAAAANLRVGRTLATGFWLGLAAVYKSTPLLFLPYLCFKRQWRAAGAMAVFIVGLSLAPALWLGWHANIRAHERWWTATLAMLASTDPVENTVEPPNIRNQSLVVALARLVQSYPPGHSLYLEHPLFLQFGDLELAAAKRFVQAILLLLAGILAWRFRKSCSLADVDGERQEDALREWAVVTVFVAILSPLCWLQHLVLVIPVLFLLARTALQPGGLHAWQRLCGLLAAIVMVVAGQREVLGHGLFLTVLSYKVHTWAALGVIALVLTVREHGASQHAFQPSHLRNRSRRQFAEPLEVES
jgi:hypothetical protein